MSIQLRFMCTACAHMFSAPRLQVVSPAALTIHASHNAGFGVSIFVSADAFPTPTNFHWKIRCSDVMPEVCTSCDCLSIVVGSSSPS